MISKLLYSIYRFKKRSLRFFVLRTIKSIEGGELYSKTLRDIFKNYHNVEIGMYTIGGCFIPGYVDRFTSIGRYCSIARPISVNNRNHPMEFKSTHPFFYNPGLKIVAKDTIEYIPLTIGNDVWLGEYAIILPHVKMIGDGAVIGAGAVVNKDVPPYSVVVGNPARVVRYRFSKEVIEELLTSKWWENPIEKIKPLLNEYTKPYNDNPTGPL